MSRLIEVAVASGESITVEVEDAAGGPRMRGGERPAELIERSGRTLEEGLGAVAPALRAVLAEVRGVSNDLSEIKLEVGLKLTGEAGMVLARAGAEAHFVVHLTWARAAGQPV